MQIDIGTIVIVMLALLLLVVFIIVKNRKDRKELEDQIQNDYKKPADREGDIDIEEKESI